MNEPRLRFKGFNEEWKIDRLKNITTHVDYRGKTPKKENKGIQLITASNIKMGYIDYNIDKQYINKSTYKDVMHRGYPNIGEVLITTEAPLGNVALINIKNIALAQRVIKYTGIKNKFSNKYILYLFESNSFRKNIFSKATGGTVKGIKGHTLHNVKVWFPIYNEQKKIGSFLEKLDQLIQLQSNKLEHLNTTKKGYLNKFFPNYENNVPKIRFNKFNDKWEEYYLKSMLESVVDNRGKTPTHTSEKTIHPILEVSSLGDYYPNHLMVKKYVDENTFKNWFRNYLRIGDILFSTVGNTGITSMVNSKNDVIAQNIIGLRFNNNIDNKFSLAMLSNIRNIKKSKRIEMGAIQPSIKVTQLLKIKYKIPNIYEQEKIGQFFSNLDQQITLQQQKLDNLKRQKKAYLQKMFI